MFVWCMLDLHLRLSRTGRMMGRTRRSRRSADSWQLGAARQPYWCSHGMSSCARINQSRCGKPRVFKGTWCTNGGFSTYVSLQEVFFVVTPKKDQKGSKGCINSPPKVVNFYFSTFLQTDKALQACHNIHFFGGCYMVWQNVGNMLSPHRNIFVGWGLLNPIECH